MRNTASGAASATFVYDGDGSRVKATVGGVTTTYLGNYYEWNGTAGVKYYYAGSQRIAMRDAAGTLFFLFGDHLGSTSKVATAAGAFYSEIRYGPWGEARYVNGTTPTNFHFTGQREEAGIGLYYYGARWYDTAIRRWMQADTIVPGAGNPQTLNRYTFVLNNPLKYTDPTGHRECDLQCQEQYEQVDPIQIHNGEYYYGGCWGAIECFGLNEKVIELENVDKGNIELQAGQGVAVFGAGGVRADMGFVADGKGNLALTLTIGGGGYAGVGGGYGPYVTVYDAPSVQYLEGRATQFGAQVGDGLTVGAEKVFFTGPDGQNYSGTSLSEANRIQAPWPGEVHATVTRTWILASINIPRTVASFLRSLK